MRKEEFVAYFNAVPKRWPGRNEGKPRISRAKTEGQTPSLFLRVFLRTDFHASSNFIVCSQMWKTKPDLSMPHKWLVTSCLQAPACRRL
jgi:hypothetical protein